MTNSFDILHPGPWFGPRSESLARQPGVSGETRELLALCEELKGARFAARSSLESLILSSGDGLIRRQALRLYCFVARHEDVAFLGRFLEGAGYDDILTIIVSAPYTLSPQIIPHLFALLERSEAEEFEEDILSSINMLIPLGYRGGAVSLAELVRRFAESTSSSAPSHYYFAGAPAHPGTLTKELIEAAALARHGSQAFPLAIGPTLLSVWSAERCPIFYGQSVDDASFEEVLLYVQKIASVSWESGSKYFYRQKVV